MNDVIKWIATHNTLMIQIGFSAVVLLLVVYAFREFFVPKVKVVSDDINASASGDVGNSLQKNALTDSADRVAEIEKFKKEVEKLKNQLADSEVQIADLKNKVLEGPSTTVSAAQIPAVEKQAAEEVVSQSASAEPTSVASAPSNVTENSTVVPDAGAAAELAEKVQQLEARLAEYEIIAEDIAEIGQLRKENDELKKQIGAKAALSEQTKNVEVASDVVAEPVPVPVEKEEVMVETTPLQSKAELTIESTKPISENEKDLMNQFADSSKKESS